MKSSEMLQRIILAKTSEELDTFISRLRQPVYTFDNAVAAALCVHPLLTMEQARKLHASNKSLLPLLAENAALRLQLQTDPAVLLESGTAFRELESLLQAVPDAEVPLHDLRTATNAAENPFNVANYLLEEGNRLTKEETNLLARLLLVMLQGLESNRWTTHEYAFAGASKLILSLPKETWRSDFLSKIVSGGLSKALVHGEHWMVVQSRGLYLHVVGDYPERTEPFLRYLYYRLLEGGSIGSFPSSIVPGYADAALLNQLRTAVVRSLMRKDPPMLEECSLAVWALTTSGVAGLLRALAENEHVSDERIRALLAIAGVRGEFRGHDPLPNPGSEGPADEPVKRYWWKGLGLLVGLALLTLAGILVSAISLLATLRGESTTFMQKAFFPLHIVILPAHLRNIRKLWIHRDLFLT